MDVLTLLDYLIRGLSLGSVYAIIALGYTMVYGIAKMLNFAHGDVIMVGAYVCFFAMTGLSPMFGCRSGARPGGRGAVHGGVHRFGCGDRGAGL